MRSDNLEAPTLEELAHLEVVQLLPHDAPRAWACGWCGWHRLERALGEWRCERCHGSVMLDLGDRDARRARNAPAWDSTPYVPRHERE